MRPAVRLISVALATAALAPLLTACAQLTDSEVSWCANHEDRVRSAASTLGIENQVEWRRTGGTQQYQFDSMFAEACRAALEKDPTSR